MDIDSKTVNQKICFVLPTYNEEENIENIIELIIQESHNQSKSVFSILVVDDNSSDQTQDIVERVIDSANIYKGHYHILGGTLNSNENYES